MRSLIAVVALVLIGSAARAATVVEFYGPHPIDPKVHAGLCLLDGPHLHSYTPHDEVLYVQDGPYWTYVGDPTEFEPSLPARHAYYGHHPVWWTHDPGEHYCYITGPHHHGHAPRHDVHFVERGGAYWYVGAHPAWYERHKKHKHKRIDDHYHHHHIVRPVVTVAPPVGWVGVRFDVGPIGVQIGAPVPVHGVVIEQRPPPVEDHHHHHPPKWGHHKDDPHFPGKHGKHGKNGKNGKGRP